MFHSPTLSVQKLVPPLLLLKYQHPLPLTHFQELIQSISTANECIILPPKSSGSSKQVESSTSVVSSRPVFPWRFHMLPWFNVREKLHVCKCCPQLYPNRIVDENMRIDVQYPPLLNGLRPFLRATRLWVSNMKSASWLISVSPEANLSSRIRRPFPCQNAKNRENTLGSVSGAFISIKKWLTACSIIKLVNCIISNTISPSPI